MYLPTHKINLLLVSIFLLIINFTAHSQCSWVTDTIETFEHSTPISGIVSGTLYHSNPNANSGRAPFAKGFYMNFVTNLTSNTKVFSRSYQICVGTEYRINTWLKEVNGGSSTVMVRVKDSNNLVLTSETNTYSKTGAGQINGWYNWISPSFTPTTSIIYFEIIYISGIGNNDFGMDDLSLEVCGPPIIQEDVHLCYNQVPFNLFDSLVSPTGTTGIWNGPSTLTNAHLGTYDPANMLGGLYQYTITNPVANCPDSSGLVNIFLGVGPQVDLGADIELCTGDTLQLSAVNINATYLWNDNSTVSTLTVNQGGTYWVEVTDSCGITRDTIIVDYHNYPVVELGNDTNLCIGDSLLLGEVIPNATYQWNNWSTDSLISTWYSGTYSLTVTAFNCSTSDTISAIFYPNPIVNLGNDITMCLGDTTTLDAQNSNANFLWQDGSSAGVLPVYQTGTYWVNVEEYNCSTSDTINVQVNLPPTVDLGQDTTLCDGELFTINVFFPNATYLWQDNTKTDSMIIRYRGTYFVRVSNNCGTVTDSLNVNLQSYPTVDLGTDTVMCTGDVKTLLSLTPLATYLWENGATDSIRNITTSGQYQLNVTLNNCTASDTVSVTVNPMPIANLGSDTTLCSSAEFEFDVFNQGASYLWSDSTELATFQVLESGFFKVEITLENCITSDSIDIELISCEVNLEMPNIFTPNADGINDLFIPVLQEGVATMQTIIYNRWGNQVFATTKPEVQWNGTDDSGNIVSDGVYYWVVQIHGLDAQPYDFKGVVTLNK